MGKRRILTAKGPRLGMRTTRIVMTREAQLGRRRLSYCEGGVGAPLLLIHGLGASSRWWFPLFPELTSANLRIVAPDLPGFGRTPGPAPSIPEAARVVIDLADHLNLAHFFLAGHSMGGAIAAQLAADFGGRVRRLVLIDSAGMPTAVSGRWLGRLAQPWSWCPPGFYGTLLGDVLKAGPRSMRAGVLELRRYDIRPALERIRPPTLVIWGERDSLTPLESGRKIAAALPQGHLEVVPRARHLPMVSDAGTTARLVVKFLREELRSSSSTVADEG